jgi:preprotein translocase subunit SecE
MAKTMAIANSGESLEKMKAWPERIKTFYNDVRNEMRKVSTPSLKEVQGTTTVVMITVFLFALYLLDGGFGDRQNSLERACSHYLARH